MTDNDNKNKLTGKLQLKKTINAGQIKQSFSHGRSRSVSVEVKKKRSLSGFSKNEIEKFCWMAVHEHMHGVLPSEYDIRETDEDLYLELLQEFKSNTY